MPKKQNIYEKSEKIHPETILIDQKKTQWVVGKLIGEGGFGAIYLARNMSSKKDDFVVKIEPDSNGPLYTEVNFYKRVCLEDDILKFSKEHNLVHLGVPKFLGTGTFNSNRFLVMERFGEDLHKIMKKTMIPKSTILQITINIVDILQYIHSFGYVHGDIKALNVLKDMKTNKRIFMVDFGMVSIYRVGNEHKPDKIDKKLQHNGTLDFCPLDSHVGRISSRRSDIESLLYNMIFWLTWDNKNPKYPNLGNGTLPWLDMVEEYNRTRKNPILNQIYKLKEECMSNINSFVQKVKLDKEIITEDLIALIRYIANLQYTECPDYVSIRNKLATMCHKYRTNSNTKLPNQINMNKFRDIDWSESSPIIKRTSTTQSIKETEDNDDTSSIIKRPGRKRTVNKPIYNNIEREHSSRIPTKTKLNKSRSRSSPRNEKSERIMRSRSGKNQKYNYSTSDEELFESSSKENITENESTITKTTTTTTIKASTSTRIKTPINQHNNNINKLSPASIIPGLKSYKRVTPTMKSKLISPNSTIPGLKCLNKNNNNKVLTSSRRSSNIIPKEIIPGLKSIQRVKEQNAQQKYFNKIIAERVKKARKSKDVKN